MIVNRKRNKKIAERRSGYYMYYFDAFVKIKFFYFMLIN